jgi:hypothetical protein
MGGEHLREFECALTQARRLREQSPEAIREIEYFIDAIGVVLEESRPGWVQDVFGHTKLLYFPEGRIGKSKGMSLQDTAEFFHAFFTYPQTVAKATLFSAEKDEAGQRSLVCLFHTRAASVHLVRLFQEGRVAPYAAMASDEEATRLFAEGLSLHDISDAADEVGQRKAFGLMKRAVQLGLGGSAGIFARLMVAMYATFDVSNEARQHVLDSGLESVPEAEWVVAQFEAALASDRESGGQVLNGLRAVHLLDGPPILWMCQSRFLAKQRGDLDSAVYLEERMALLNHLSKTYLPRVCLELGLRYESGGVSEKASAWLSRAIGAETLSNADTDAKRLAKKRLDVLQQRHPKMGREPGRDAVATSPPAEDRGSRGALADTRAPLTKSTADVRTEPSSRPLRDVLEGGAEVSRPAGEPPTSIDSYGRILRPEPPSAEQETVTDHASKGPGRGIALWIGAGVIVVLAGLALFLASRDQSNADEQTAATRASPPVAGRGNLRVEVNVPARATLDGWHLPDGGSQLASVLVFTDVEATTHTLEVWSEGYRRESSSVVVKAGQTVRVAVNLQPAARAAAAQHEAWLIERLDVRLDIQPDQSILALETVDVDFQAESRHGIYRDLWSRPINDDAEGRKHDIGLIGVTDAVGRPYQVTESMEGAARRIRIGDPDRIISGRATYRIAYGVRYALKHLSTHDELYWNATGEWPVPIRAASVVVSAQRQHIQKVDCLQGPSGSKERCGARLGLQGADAVFTSTRGPCRWGADHGCRRDRQRTSCPTANRTSSRGREAWQIPQDPDLLKESASTSPYRRNLHYAPEMPEL